MDVFKVIRQERVSERVVEQFVAWPQIQEHVAKVCKLIPQEQVSERTMEQIVAVPQIQERAVGVQDDTDPWSSQYFFEDDASSHRCF